MKKVSDKTNNEQSKRRPYFVTFYSFKGGVGRSLAAVNVAMALAQNRRKVLLVDFDLEAPGITQFEECASLPNRGGLIDLIHQYKKNYADTLSLIKKRKKISRKEKQDLLSPDKLFLPGTVANLITRHPKFQNLSFLPAGKINCEYYEKLTSLNMASLYSREKGYIFFSTLKEHIARLDPSPDYVIFDARAGVSDIGWPPVVQYPDLVIVLCVPNEQNIQGTEFILKRLSERKPDPPKLLPVLSLISPYELDLLKKQRERALEVFNKILKTETEKPLTGKNLIQIPYHPLLTFWQGCIMIRDEWIGSEWEREYLKICKEIIERNEYDWLFHYNKAEELFNQRKMEEARKYYDRALSLGITSEEELNSLGIKYDLIFHDQIRAEKAFRDLIDLNPKSSVSWSNLGLILSKDPKRKKEAEESYRRALKINPELSEALYNLGNLLSEDPKRKKEAEESYRRALKINPDDAEVWSKLGFLLSEDMKRKKEAETSFLKSIEINPVNIKSYLALYILKKKQGDMAKAFNYFSEALKILKREKESPFKLELIKSLKDEIKELEKSGKFSPQKISFLKKRIQSL